MAGTWFKQVTIIGVGLLGGSVALAIRQRFAGVRILGVGRRAASLDEALRGGIIDEGFLDAAAGVAGSDLVILATPVGAFQRHLQAIAPALKRTAIVTDVGSTKAEVVKLARKILGKGGRFVGSHPMAGSDRRGPSHARADLLTGATCIVTPTADTSPTLARQVEQFWRALGMKVVRMTPARHDRSVAIVSHLPHAMSAVLMSLPSQAELAVSASGFADMTRLAGGDMEMWRDILMSNRREILAAIGRFEKSLTRLGKMVSRGRPGELERFLGAAQKRRGRLTNGRS